jgi:hypothetical protein
MSRLRYVCALAAATLAGCGGPTDEERVRQVLQRFGQAVAAKDYSRVCNDLLARSLVRKLDSVGVPCGLALAKGLEGVRGPSLEVVQVKVRSDTLALAQVRTTAANQPPSVDTVRVVKEGEEWRVASLSGAQPPAPRRRAPGAVHSD